MAVFKSTYYQKCAVSFLMIVVIDVVTYVIDPRVLQKNYVLYSTK